MHNSKVCHLTSVHPPFDTRIFHKECKALADAGFAVSLVVPHVVDEKVAGIRICSVPVYKSRLRRFLLTILAVYRRAVKEDADIYHFHDFELIPIALLLKLKGKRVVYDSHEDFPRQNLSREWLAPCLRQFICITTEWFENMTVRAFDAVIGATPHITERFVSLGCEAININNYPTWSQDQLPPEALARSREVCYVGNIAAQRGIVEMVEAIGKTDVKLKIAGNFDDSGLLASLTKLPGWQQVVRLGFLSRAEVWELLPTCVGGLVIFHPEPNHLYSQPTKMYEYMAAGIPVIVSDFPVWRSIIEKHRCGLFVDPLDSTKLAETIQWLADHPAEARQMGENGRLAVLTEYNWQVEEKKLIDLYEKLSDK